MVKYITINDIDFELQNQTIVLPIVELHPHRTLLDCYDKPSKEKIAEYEQWLKFANSVDAQGFTIDSYNKYRFTLTFQFRYKGVKYHAVITKTHNRLYRI